VDSGGRGVGRSGGRVKAEAALGSARHRNGRTSTPRSVIVISDTEDDPIDAPNTLSVLLLLLFVIIRAADRLKILIAINYAIKKFNRD